MKLLVDHLQRILAPGTIQMENGWKGIGAIGCDQAIRKGDRILCPHCKEQIGSLARIKDMIVYCKEFSGQCRCG